MTKEGARERPPVGASGNGRSRDTIERPRGSALEFFLIVFALSIPFWLAGDRPLPVPMNLPASSLQWLLPLIVAVILLLRREGRRSARRFLRRILDHEKISPRIWYLPIVLGPPAILLLTYAVMRSLGLPLPEPRIAVVSIPVLLAAFFVSGMFEEAGWMGYAFDRIACPVDGSHRGDRSRVGPFGVHIVPNLQQGHALVDRLEVPRDDLHQGPDGLAVQQHDARARSFRSPGSPPSFMTLVRSAEPMPHAPTPRPGIDALGRRRHRGPESSGPSASSVGCLCDLSGGGTHGQAGKPIS